MFKQLNQTGRSMVEVIGVIGILTILAIGAWKSVDYGMGFYHANNIKVSAEEMIKKIEQFAVWDRDYKNLYGQGFGESENNITTYYCGSTGLDFPSSFCSGTDLDSDKISVYKGRYVGTTVNNRVWTPQFDGDVYHFSIVFKVGREACRQLRKVQNGGDGRMWSARIRQVAPTSGGQAFCSKYYPNQFAFTYPR